MYRKTFRIDLVMDGHFLGRRYFKTREGSISMLEFLMMGWIHWCMTYSTWINKEAERVGRRSTERDRWIDRLIEKKIDK